MKKILITGGGGFVGGHLIKALQKKYKVLSIDINNNPNSVHGDVRNFEAMKNFCKDIDICIILSGELPHQGWSSELPKGTMWDIMVNGTENVLKACEENNVKKVIYFSSSAVYGEPISSNPIEENPATTLLFNPLDEYGKAKLEAEKICNEYMDNGLNITIIRPMTILGPNFVGILRSMMEFIYYGKRVPIIGDGSNKIQLIHIDDVVSAVIKCIETKSNDIFNTFNITSDIKNMPTIKEELDELCRYAGTGAKVWPIPSWIVRPVMSLTRVVGKATMGKEIAMLADKTFLTDNSKAKKLLKWKPKYNNIEALKAGYDWFRMYHETAKPKLSLPLKIAMVIL